MKKVKVTKEQAEAIERWADKIQLVKAKLFGFLNHGEDESIAEMTDDELIEALYIGYEVEQEFKVGDWVVHEDGYIGKITKINDKGVIFIDVELGNGRFVNTVSKYYRHATLEEIETEKERRWWAKHGREVRELRAEDIIYTYSTGLRFVGSNDKTHITRIINFDGFKVICFAENRLDVKENN